jgi:hypothetical protein
MVGKDDKIGFFLFSMEVIKANEIISEYCGSIEIYNG